MTRVLAYILRFVQNAKSKSVSKNKLNYITTQELDLSLSMILKYEQEKYLSEDIHALKCKKTIVKGHFLIGTALNTYPEPNVNITKQSQFWKTCNEIKMSFWKVWSKHYLNLLQSRPKWQDIQPNVKVGALVILRDDNLSPLYWPLARVINTYPGKDGKVRVVEVKTANGHTHKRAVMKVCVLPLECSGAG
ncbi:unnamed protein product [Parnassius mnemosyne]|uniref:DUF5641 domain-containing protein n=1 Tax=Parnassius mnemosyne TaxID=213953 RepID=A0AAV1KZX2_9NEOP